MPVSLPTPTMLGTLALRVPSLDAVSPLDAAERVRGLPGLVLLESARPGPHARWSYLAVDPVAVVDAPSEGSDPLAGAARLLRRLDATADDAAPSAGAPPFRGGLAGYLGYDVGRRLERLPEHARADQALPGLHLGLYDLVVAWERATGKAWLCGRAVDGDARALDERARALVARLTAAASAPALDDRLPARFVSNFDRPAWIAAVERVRAAIADGEIYQANVARRLEASFDADAWPLYRRLRTGDPTPFAAFLDLGRDATGRPRAIASASPEPFLAADADGVVRTHPIKGTRARGRTRAEDRCLAGDLLASRKDRAENVMIVDVLRNDLGRVCEPGTVRVPRLCRLERTAAVQHLVSSVTGRLARGNDAFALLRASFPGGSITGAPKIRAMELIGSIEPVQRGPYTGAAVWLDRDGGLGSSILIRTFVVEGPRVTLHVGGGITWRSDAAAEWDETRAKAAGPLGAIGAAEA